jgi:hypothetical protein
MQTSTQQESPRGCPTPAVTGSLLVGSLWPKQTADDRGVTQKVDFNSSLVALPVWFAWCVAKWLPSLPRAARQN